MANLDDKWTRSRNELVDAAESAGIDPGIMAKIAGFESRFDPNARPISTSRPWLNKVEQFDGVMAMSSGHGYGQFLDGTWEEMVNKYGEKYGIADASRMSTDQANAPEIRTNSALQAGMLAEFTRENIEKGTRLGGPDADANVYAFHNLGEGDATKFLAALKNAPNQRIDAVLSARVIAGNPALYGDGSRSVNDSYQAMGRQMDAFEKYALEAAELLAQRKNPLHDIQNFGQRLLEGKLKFETQAPGSLPDYLQVDPAHHASVHAPRDTMSDGRLRQGEQGPTVRSLQEDLTRLGIKDGHGHTLVSDGVFGANTRDAVENFQLWNGLSTTGIADRDTLIAIRNARPPIQPERIGDTAPHGQSREPAALTPPTDPGHPDHAMLEQIRRGVRAIDECHGRHYDEASERISRCLLAACKDPRDMQEDGHNVSLASNALDRVDHVLMGNKGHLFAVEGGLDDPAHKRAFVSVEQAVQIPVEQSDLKLHVANELIAQQREQTRQQELTQELSNPGRGLARGV